MPRVIITRFAYAHTNEQALAMAREARMNGMRSEIITDERYTTLARELGEWQNLKDWAKDNNVEFVDSI